MEVDGGCILRVGYHGLKTGSTLLGVVVDGFDVFY